MRGLQAETREIDSEVYTITPMSATEGLKLLASLSRLLGGPLGKAVAAVKAGSVGDFMDSDFNSEHLGEAVSSLADRLEEDRVLSLVKRLVAGVQVRQPDSKDVSLLSIFDLHFQGRYLVLFQVVGAVLEVNYRLPLSGLPALLQRGPRGKEGEPS